MCGESWKEFGKHAKLKHQKTTLVLAAKVESAFGTRDNDDAAAFWFGVRDRPEFFFEEGTVGIRRFATDVSEFFHRHP